MDDLLGLIPDVSRETIDRLRHYESLILKWTARINLISRGTEGEIWTRHILDSAQISNLLPVGAETLRDLGSGGGFPGVVLAILRPDLQVTLVESDLRKATFLRTALRETDTNALVLAKRIEDLPQAHPDILTARALAPLPDLLKLSLGQIGDSTTAFFLKGAQAEKELEAARKDYHFMSTLHPSITHPRASIIELQGIQRV